MHVNPHRFYKERKPLEIEIGTFARSRNKKKFNHAYKFMYTYLTDLVTLA